MAILNNLWLSILNPERFNPLQLIRPFGMEIFALDILSGILLVVSIIEIALSIIIHRYRGGIGPRIMLVSGMLILTSSITWLLIILGPLSLTKIVVYIGWGMGMIAGALSLITWRVKR